MREMAKNNDYSSFKSGVTNLTDSETRSLFNAVKKGMGIARDMKTLQTISTMI